MDGFVADGDHRWQHQGRPVGGHKQGRGVERETRPRINLDHGRRREGFPLGSNQVEPCR